jgi:PAS domain S-box-containing protein
MSETASPPENLSNFQTARPLILFCLAIAGVYATSLYSYLLFHTLVEMFCIFVMLSVFLLSWNSRRLLENHYFLFLAISFISSGTFELLHTLSYKGFGVFPGYDANLPTQLWIAFRYVFSLSLLAAPIFVTRKINTAVTVSAFVIFTSLLLSLIFSGNFPDCFVEGKGLTPFKIISEYLTIVILLASIGFLFAKRHFFDPRVTRALISAIIAAIAAGASFTQYISVYGQANLLGHLFLFLSAFLVYMAIVDTGIKEPAKLLFRDLELKKEELRGSEDRLRFALETSRIGAWDLDLANHTAFRSLEHDRIFGYEELLPEWTFEMFLDHILPEDRSMVETKFSIATKCRSDWSFECRIRRTDGEVRWIWAAGRHKSGPAEGGYRMAGIVQDITERKNAEEKINKNALELKSANIELDNSRRAAMNLLEDALAARRKAEETAAELSKEAFERQKAQEKIQRHLKELRETNEELTGLTRAMAGREIRMIELKGEVNEYRAKAGLPPRYNMDFDQET